MSSFLRGPPLGRELVKMRSLEGDRDRSEGKLTGSVQATPSALLHAGSKTAEIKGFAVSTAFHSLNINSLSSIQQRRSQLSNPSPATGPGWLSFFRGKKDCPAMNKTRRCEPEDGILSSGKGRPAPCVQSLRASLEDSEETTVP